MRETGTGRYVTMGAENGVAGAIGTPRATDAAQFMPFAALSGYYDLVREQERHSEPRRVPTEEHMEEVSRMLMRLRKGDEVFVVHYERNAYTVTSGTVRQVDEAMRSLDLTSGKRILFEDIWDVHWA